ncbi:hypothetical protein AAIH46_17900 [Rhizobium sp. 0TCS1.26]|uniref:hypothetical protein n=1 Tax=Rhizobium sp. 0TCS1.26 TaxID=3142623 RepID=UPI003D2C6347
MIIDREKRYAVKLTRAVKSGGFTHKPLNEIEMAGEILSALFEEHGEDAIQYARPL